MRQIYSSVNKSKIHKHLTKKTYKDHTHNPLAAFNYMPEPNLVNFSAKDNEEKIILLLRKHPITNVGWIISAIFLLFVPLVVSFGLSSLISSIPKDIQIIGILIWYLITLAFIIEEFLSWFFNVYIITDERVFDVDFVNLTYRKITDANIDQIQDVSSKIGGVIGTLINYGDVFIQTASATPQIEFEKVPNPDRVAAILRDLRIEEEKEKLEGRVR